MHLPTLPEPAELYPSPQLQLLLFADGGQKKNYRWFAHLILAQNERERRTAVIPVCTSKSGEISGPPLAEWPRATCPDVWRLGSGAVIWGDAFFERLPGSSQSSWTSRPERKKKKKIPISIMIFFMCVFFLFFCFLDLPRAHFTKRSLPEQFHTLLWKSMHLLPKPLEVVDGADKWKAELWNEHKSHYRRPAADAATLCSRWS